MRPFPFLRALSEKINRPLYVLSIETTGFYKPGIVKISCIGISPQGEVARKDIMINPKKKIDPRATAIHGISDDHVKNESFFDRHIPLIEKMYKSGVVCGYENDYDFRLIKNNVQSSCFDLPGPKMTLDIRNLRIGLTGTRKDSKMINLLYHYNVDPGESRLYENDVLLKTSVLDAMVAQHGISLVENYIDKSTNDLDCKHNKTEKSIRNKWNNESSYSM